MGLRRLVFGFFLLFVSAAFAAAEGLSTAAAYYYDHQEYRQALRLYKTWLERDPSSLTAATRLADLKAMFEGRAAAREVLLGYLSTNGDALSADSVREARARVVSLSHLFLTDEGQATYYQGLAKRQVGDCAGALPLFTQSALLEAGQARALRQKAYCERALGMVQPSLESLSQAFESNPFDVTTGETLSETELFVGEPQRVIARYRRNPELAKSVRARVALAVALSEVGEKSEAIARLQALLQEQKAGVVPAVVYSVLGEGLASRADSVNEAAVFLDRFVSLAEHPGNLLVDGWDPYKCPDRVASAQKVIQKLRSRNRR